MNKDLERKLLDLKGNIDKKEREVIQAQGALEQLQSQLKEEFGISSLEDAEKLLEGFTQEEKELEKRVEDKVQDIESKYEF